MSSTLNMLSDRRHPGADGCTHEWGDETSWWPLVLTIMYECYVVDQDEKEH